MNNRKAIILAGGSGTRLYPITTGISKQLLPVYDKPMIYYPLSVLMLAGLRDILIITTKEDLEKFKYLLSDGSQWGINISYKIQPSPDGLAQAFILAEDFISNDPSVLILGDNIFHGHNLEQLLEKPNSRIDGATVFVYHVNDPQRYGVAEFDSADKVIAIEEKPIYPKSNFAVTGLYFYDSDVCEYVKKIKPSKRGELEITDLNKIYLSLNKLFVQKMTRGYTWLDTGTHDSLLEASSYISTIEKRQGLKIACPEEIAFKKGWISKADLQILIKPLLKNEYGSYLEKISNENNIL